MAYIDINIYSRCLDIKMRLNIRFFLQHICNPTQASHCLVTFMQLNLLFTPVTPPAQRGKICCPCEGEQRQLVMEICEI